MRGRLPEEDIVTTPLALSDAIQLALICAVVGGVIGAIVAAIHYFARRGRKRGQASDYVAWMKYGKGDKDKNIAPKWPTNVTLTGTSPAIAARPEPPAQHKMYYRTLRKAVPSDDDGDGVCQRAPNCEVHGVGQHS